jgi:hypothetical protein
MQRFIAPRSCRKLTAAEQALARSIFGDALKLETTKLCEHPLVLKGYAVSPNGSVYFHPGELPTDFGDESLGRQAWLIHELTHVWQVQQGSRVFVRALFDRRYDYELKTAKPFSLFGVEQQARMVEDLFLRRARGLECTLLARCIPFDLGSSDDKSWPV